MFQTSNHTPGDDDDDDDDDGHDDEAIRCLVGRMMFDSREINYNPGHVACFLFAFHLLRDPSSETIHHDFIRNPRARSHPSSPPVYSHGSIQINSVA